MKNKTKIIGIILLFAVLLSSTAAMGYEKQAMTNNKKQIVAEPGTVTVPGYTFSNERNTGFWMPTNGNVGLSIMGINRWTWSTNGAFASTSLTLLGDNWIGFRSGNQRVYSEDSHNMNIVSNDNLNLICEDLTMNGQELFTGKVEVGQTMYVENGLIVNVQ